jgi:hypothetical protein
MGPSVFIAFEVALGLICKARKLGRFFPAVCITNFLLFFYPKVILHIPPAWTILPAKKLDSPKLGGNMDKRIIKEEGKR